MSEAVSSDLFDANYYATGCGRRYERNEEWLAFFGQIAQRVIADIGPRVVLDAGCALGLLVEALRVRGVEAYGRDVSAFAVEAAHPSIRPYVELGSIADPFPRHYDLIISMEVLEHMQPAEARAAIANLCRHTDDILFSSTPFDYKEATHFNVQPPEVWAELFAQQGFYRDVDYDASYITEWAVRFRRRTDPAHRVIRDYERGYWLLRKENQDLRSLVLEMRQGDAQPVALRGAAPPESALVAAVNDLAAELAQRDAALNELQGRWRSLEGSPGYAVLRGLQGFRRRIAPPLSSRDQILEAALRMARSRSLAAMRTETARIRQEIGEQVGMVRRRREQAAYERRNGPALTVNEAPARPPVTPHVAQVDIVVCVHNALDDTRRCLESVSAQSNPPYRLILVDDGSDAETCAYLADFAAQHGAQLIRNEAARGYTYAANQGMAATDGDFVILLNSDTVVGPGWLDRLVGCATSDPKIGLVGPLSNAATWQSVPEVITGGQWANNPLPDGFTVADMAAAIANFSARLYPRVPILNGFCLMIKRETLDKVGLFDEQNFGVGYGEENDYCLRARAAGWDLALADDVYVWHAGSKSYSSEKARGLSERANETLKRKHGAGQVDRAVAFLSDDRVLQGIRNHAAVAPEQETLMRRAREQWAGRRLLWLLPVMFSGGGGAVVATKAALMREMGIDVAIFNLNEYREQFERNYPTLDVPVIYGRAEDVTRVGREYEAVIATAYESAFWLMGLAAESPQTTLGYFIQDFEPHFYDPDSSEHKLAWASYSVVPHLKRFATTSWIQNEVVTNTGMDCGLVGGCYNAALFRPRPRPLPEWPHRPLRIAAMIRPATAYRAPRLTMEVMQRVARRYGDKVEIRLFGANPLDARFQALPRDFPYRLAGVLNQPQAAMFLNEADIFVDFSTFQALGITAQEAMSCGAAVVVPEKGGTRTFARHEHNALIVDSSSADACFAATARLIEDHDLRRRLQRAGMAEVCAYHPVLPTYNILHIILQEA